VNEDMFIGITDRSSTQHNAGQLPNGQYVGFYFNGANFRFIHASGGAPTNVDAGVAPSATGGSFFSIDVTATNSVTFTIYDLAGTQIATHTATTNLPSAATGLKHLVTYDKNSINAQLRFHKIQLGSAA